MAENNEIFMCSGLETEVKSWPEEIIENERK